MKYLILTIVIITLLVIGLGIHINNSNEEYRLNTGYVNGTVLEVKEHWNGTFVIVKTDDGTRDKVRCLLCLVGDRVLIETHEGGYSYLEKRYPNTIEVNNK